jgi:hypothetical protein
MAKITHKTLVKKLVEHYSEGLTTQEMHTALGMWKAQYDREMIAPMADWDYFLWGQTTDRNVYSQLQRTLNAYFGMRHYDWLLAQYKHIKQSIVA